MGSSHVLDALLLGLLAGFGATALGALPAALLRTVGARSRAGLEGLSAGVMLAATFFSLLSPGLDRAIESWGRWGGVAIAAGSLVLGTILVAVLHRFSPHEHFIKGPEGADRAHLARAWLFVIAITIHNFPEGLSVGVGAASGELQIAVPIAVGIGFQNVPEGFIVAASLLQQGYSRTRAIGVAWATGAVEPIGALLGAGVLAISASILPAALCFAAGAMLFVISAEVLPESHRSGHASTATWGVMAGFVLMMVLDVVFAA